LVSRLGYKKITQCISQAVTVPALTSSTLAHRLLATFTLQPQTTFFPPPDTAFSVFLIALSISIFITISTFLLSISSIPLGAFLQLLFSIALAASLILLVFQFRVFIVASEFFLTRAVSVFHCLLFLLFALLFLVLFAYPGVASRVRVVYHHDLSPCLVSFVLVSL
jgi:hypothetical protein